MLKDILVKTNRYIKNRNNKKLSLLIKKYFFKRSTIILKLNILRPKAIHKT